MPILKKMVVNKTSTFTDIGDRLKYDGVHLRNENNKVVYLL